MTDRKHDPVIRAVATVAGPEVHPNWRKYRIDMPFTKSNGTIMARIYERLTKRSRRNEQSGLWPDYGHDAYRQGVYDTLKALQEELR